MKVDINRMEWTREPKEYTIEDGRVEIVMYLDSENWLKGSIEYENEEFQHLGSVVTNNGYSDWATTAIDASVKSMRYRLSRREDSSFRAVFTNMEITECKWPAYDVQAPDQQIKPADSGRITGGEQGI